MTILAIALGCLALSIFAQMRQIGGLHSDLHKTKRRLREFRIEQRAKDRLNR